MYLKGRMIRFLAIVFIVLLGSGPFAQAAQEPARLLILFPKLNAAYDRVFGEIVSGINSHDRVISQTFILTESTTKEEIQRRIEADDIDALIALGQSSYDMAQRFNDQLPVIFGGMLLSASDHSGISLAGSPAQFFSHLELIAPTVRRVFTVYSEANSGWLIELAQAEAAKHHIELKAFPASDVRDALRRLRDILDQANGREDGIWILLDKVLPDQTALPMALEAAWKRNIVLFSNNPSHTRRGALFALFPDHNEMGYHLAELSLKRIQSDQHILLPLSSLRVSVNERTASHLGLRYSNDERERFDVVYPVR